MEEFIKNYKNFKNYEIVDYDKVKLIKIIISYNNKPLVIIPPYSFDGFQKIMITLNNNFDIIQKKYNIIYALCWDNNIKKESQKIIEDISDIKKQYKINEIFRVEMTNIANNIIKIQKIKNFTLFGKSAGGGIAIYIAKKNIQVKQLLLIAPGLLKTNIKLNKDIRIILSWSIDDDKIPYEKSLALINNYIKNKNNFMFISFQKGGHELHEDFFKSFN